MEIIDRRSVLCYKYLVPSFRHMILYISDRGLVKWYDRGLQNLWWEFDSLIPCDSKRLETTVFAGIQAFFYATFKVFYSNVFTRLTSP